MHGQGCLYGDCGADAGCLAFAHVERAHDGTCTRLGLGFWG